MMVHALMQLKLELAKKVNPAILRTAQLSQKPWRYERCIVNELDMDVERTDLKKWPNKPRVPHRVAMNNQTFSIFENFDYATVSKTYDLKNLLIENDAKSNDCVKITDKLSKDESIVCTINMY
jgi:hypothetical protein